METLNELITRLDLKPSSAEQEFKTARPLPDQPIYVMVDPESKRYTTFATKQYAQDLTVHAFVRYEVRP